MAETYGIFDYRGVPGVLLGTLVAGLGADSRIGRNELGIACSVEAFFQAVLIDSVNTMAWALSGGKASHKPESVAEKMLLEPRDKDDARDYVVFDSAEDFQTAWNKIIGK